MIDFILLMDWSVQINISRFLVRINPKKSESKL